MILEQRFQSHVEILLGKCLRLRFILPGDGLMSVVQRLFAHLLVYNLSLKLLSYNGKREERNLSSRRMGCFYISLQ